MLTAINCVCCKWMGALHEVTELLQGPPCHADVPTGDGCVSFRITGLFTAQVPIILPQCPERKDLLSDNGPPWVICKRPYVQG